MTARNSVPLRGRDAELARIKRRLQEVAAGVGAVIVIEGRAGLGKTRLLEECAALAVLYPDIGEPFRSVFAKIIEGIEDQAKGHVLSYAVGANANPQDLAAELSLLRGPPLST